MMKYSKGYGIKGLLTGVYDGYDEKKQCVVLSKKLLAMLKFVSDSSNCIFRTSDGVTFDHFMARFGKLMRSTVRYSGGEPCDDWLVDLWMNMANRFMGFKDTDPCSDGFRFYMIWRLTGYPTYDKKEYDKETGLPMITMKMTFDELAGKELKIVQGFIDTCKITSEESIRTR